MINDKEKIVIEVSETATLLKYLKAQLADMAGGKIKAFLEHRQISVDGVVTTKHDFSLKGGQTIVIAKKSTKGMDTSLEIIYEDDYLIAVNKPAGLLSVASDNEKNNTAYRRLKVGREGQLFVVHRLDKDTSGVLLFAKTAEMRDKLQENWGDTRLREYRAVCEGVFKEKTGQLVSFLQESITHQMYSANSGKRAVTNYEVLKENKKYSFLRVSIETGRKNQIRAQLSEAGHPVVGDKKYGAASNPLGRLGLHASRLEIIHPISGKKITISAKIGRRFTLPQLV